MKKIGMAKLKINGKTYDKPVYRRGSGLYIKPGNIGRELPRRCEVRFKDRGFKAGLDYEMGKPVYKFSDVRETGDAETDFSMNVGKLGSRTRYDNLV